MILTGKEIQQQVIMGNINIKPFFEENIEPNSYGFSLGDRLISYASQKLDCYGEIAEEEIKIPEVGYVLRPSKLYLGRTVEAMGSDYYAATLYANRSISTMGMWIQKSAPLGHTGSTIPWTLEITVTHSIRVYPNMLIGKIAFWKPLGDIDKYCGKYHISQDVEASKLSSEVAN